MKKQILGFLLLVVIACFIIACSASLEGDSQSTELAESPTATEESILTQDASDTNQPDESDDSGNDQTDVKATDEEDNGCNIDFATLGSDSTLLFECALVANFSGEVKFTPDRDRSVEPKDIRELSESNFLLTADYYRLLTGDSGKSDLLFNTLDLIKIDGKADLTLEQGSSPGGEGIVNEVQVEGLDDLAVIINPVMQSNSLANSENAYQPVQEVVSQASEFEVLRRRSFLQRLWHGAKGHLNRLRTAFLPKDLLTQPAFANDFASTLLASPSLTIVTPEADIDSKGAVYAVERDQSRERTQVFSLTEQPIKVTDRAGKVAFLVRNQTAVIDKTGLVGEPYEFRLCSFYRSNKNLLEGLAPGEVDFVRQQQRPLQFSYHAARSLTVPMYDRNCQRRCPPTGS